MMSKREQERRMEQESGRMERKRRMRECDRRRIRIRVWKEKSKRSKNVSKFQSYLSYITCDEVIKNSPSKIGLRINFAIEKDF